MTRIETGYRPHRFQADIHARLRRFSVVVAHRRFGKTVCAVNALIDAALRTAKPAARFGYVAPYRNQAKSIAWDYLKRFGMPVPGAEPNESELFIEFPNGARVRLYGADNADAMRGLYFDGVVMDEVADMKPEVWGEIVRPALADRKGWCLFIGTPKGANLFHDLYQQALGDPGWFAGLYRADETNMIDEEELRLARAAMSENQYRQEFLCDFSAAADNVLISIDQASDAARRTVREDALAGLPKVMGVDVARFGDDRTVIMRRHGIAALDPIVFQGADNMQVVGHVTAQIAQWQPDAVFVDGGRGEGVIDRLRQLGYNVIEVNFGSRPTNPRYANKRSEMWDLMAQWVRDGGAIPNDPALKTDLCVPTYSFDAANRMVLEQKDKIKARGLRSPDLADALALTFAYPVAPRSPMGMANRGRVQSDYDPYEA